MAQHIEINPTRDRKLLIHKSEIKKLARKMVTKDLVLVPLSIYFKGHLVKVSLGLGRPKKKFDKRESLKDRDVKRDIDRGLKSR